MVGNVRNMGLTSLDDLFKSEQERQQDTHERILNIPVGEIYPYARQPYSIKRPTPDLVRLKLRQAEEAAEADSRFRVNAEALKAVQPVDLTASEISVRLGATWLPPEDVARFMFELFDTPNYARFNIKVHYFKMTGNWNIEGKSYDRSSIKANNTYGTNRINGYKIDAGGNSFDGYRRFHSANPWRAPCAG